VDRLAAKVNARLRAQAPAADAERRRLLDEVRRVDQQLERLRRFILDGDTSAKVRTWLAEAEQQEAWLRRELERVETEVQQRPLQVHSGRVKQYLEDLHSTLEKGGLRARQLLQGHIERTQFWTRRGPLPGPRSSALAKGFWTV